MIFCNVSGGFSLKKGACGLRVAGRSISGEENSNEETNF